ncbi:hypothetical protein PSZ80_24225, partial [Shigella sonnei]|nr:hypothetical protein [Shigella sonnei]
ARYTRRQSEPANQTTQTKPSTKSVKTALTMSSMLQTGSTEKASTKPESGGTQQGANNTLGSKQ